MTEDRARAASPRRLYRDKSKSMVCGVCAGVADYLGADVSIVRILTAVALLVFFPPTIFAYVALCFLLPVKPQSLYRDKSDEKFWQGVRTSPKGTFSAVRMRIREMDIKLQRMERYVTSKRFNLDREFRDLGK
ncbi:MAG: envelope stress response membrane protein PspC [Lysobacterales bacterium]|nr:MAG: envelope stress response membrane protein PspC [Xanthomonadales bacterium]